MIFDTDVLIWVMRGNMRAAGSVDDCKDRAISVVTYMELLRGVRDKREMKAIKAYLTDLGFRVLPLTENIGHRASIYVEEYTLAGALGLADALVAATAVENGDRLMTGNQRHFRLIREVDIGTFRP